ncbi:YY1-associated factor 2, partial [Stegodyphus mimosarum]
MDAKKNLNSRRTKRSSKGAEENYWDCSVCTYRNSAEAFKCLMCDVRKGTSTRKPRINPQLVAQQVAQQYTQSQPKQKSSNLKPDKDKKSSGDKAAKKIRPRLKNIDRSSAQQKAVTVNNVTVIITEFQPKRRVSSDNAANGPHSSSGNSTDSSQSDSASHSEAQNGDIQSDRR